MSRQRIWREVDLRCPSASRGDEVGDIRADLRRINVPLALPVTVDLPTWAREAAIVGLAPLVNCFVCRAEAAIRSEMRCRCHGTGRCCREYDPAALDKWSEKLNTYLEPDAAVPIDGYVATGLRLLCTHFVPYEATALWYDAREFGRFCLASDDSDGDTLELLELNGGRRHGTLPITAGVGPLRFVSVLRWLAMPEHVDLWSWGTMTG